MHRLSLEETKEIQLEILSDIQRYCNEHNLTWWLDFGTLIGAVRHKGYIPWDDDIDIGMYHDDFDEFVKGYNQSTSRYRVETSLTNPNHPWSFAKVYDMNTIMYEPDENGYKFHVHVDVFIYDKAPKSDEEFVRFKKKVHTFQLLQANQTRAFRPNGPLPRRLLAYIIRVFLQLFPRGYFGRRLDIIRRKYNDSDTGRIVGYSSTDKPMEENLMLTTEMAQFEQYEFPVPVGYAEHIMKRYGFPYYELPPVEKRVRTHDFSAYSIEGGEK